MCKPLGKMFVFDQRVALDPDSMQQSKSNESADTEKPKEEGAHGNDNIVGKCIECSTPYDQISGAILCTVCRDLLLICTQCRNSLHEYHCSRHQHLKNSYFTFLDRFTIDELRAQCDELQELHDITIPAKEHRNVRKTLRKQIDKIHSRLKDLELGVEAQVVHAKRHCRTCFKPEDVCDGLCWGFWKSSNEDCTTKD